jgi:hypothetical protein
MKFTPPDMVFVTLPSSFTVSVSFRPKSVCQESLLSLISRGSRWGAAFSTSSGVTGELDGAPRFQVTEVP